METLNAGMTSMVVWNGDINGRAVLMMVWSRGINGRALFSLFPRPHSLMRRNGLVNQVEFLGLVGALATV